MTLAGEESSQLDVIAVQSFLNNWILYGALKDRTPLLTSGKCDRAMIEALGTFQRIVLGFRKPDYRVDPNGKTWKKQPVWWRSRSAGAMDPTIALKAE